MRGTPQPDVFQLFFLGEEFDLSPLKETKDIETVQKVMNAVIGREDIKILDITWRGEWRPNIRMADHFRVGRVFIVGGWSSSIKVEVLVVTTALQTQGMSIHQQVVKV